MRRLRPLSEAECYTRCYGGWEQTVRLVAGQQQRRGRPAHRSSGEALRRLFEERLASRGTEAA